MMYALVLLAAAARLLPHAINVAPVGAMGLFLGAHDRGRRIWLWAAFLLVAGDAVRGFYSPIVMAAVYLGFAAAAVIGRLALRRVTAPRIALAAVGSASAFFLLSNFGCWAAGMYPPTWSGLAHCYVMAIPYFPNTLLGDLFYSGVMFGLFAAAQRTRLWRSSGRHAVVRREDVA